MHTHTPQTHTHTHTHSHTSGMVLPLVCLGSVFPEIENRYTKLIIWRRGFSVFWRFYSKIRDGVIDRSARLPWIFLTSFFIGQSLPEHSGVPVDIIFKPKMKSSIKAGGRFLRPPRIITGCIFGTFKKVSLGIKLILLLSSDSSSSSCKPTAIILMTIMVGCIHTGSGPLSNAVWTTTTSKHVLLPNFRYF